MCIHELLGKIKWRTACFLSEIQEKVGKGRGKETLWVEERMEMSLGVVTIHNVSVGVTQTI